MTRAILAASLSLLVTLLFIDRSAAAAEEQYTLIIADHRFEPSEVEVPAGQKIKLIVENHDSTPEEFESYDLNREKVVTGNSSIILFVGPLAPGRYEFFGEFHAETAKGHLVAK